MIRGGYGIFHDRNMTYDMQRQSLAEAPYAVPVGGRGQANYQASLANPYPQESLGWGAARNVDFATGASSDLNTYILVENFDAPQTQKWNLEIQHGLPWAMTLDMAYAGAHSIYLQAATRQLIVPDLATPTHPVYGLTTSTEANAPLRVPYLGLAASGLNAEQTQGSAKYNKLQVAPMKRESNRIHFQVSYMFSKTLTTLGAEFFNAFNHAQFDLPDTQVSNSDFGKITATSVNPRLIQFGLKFSF